MMCCNNCGWLRWVTTTNTTYYCEFDGQPLSDLKDCCQAWKSTIQTNADRIRSMTDKELADCFANFETKCYLRLEPMANCDTANFAKQILDWLKEEAKDV